MKPDCVHCSRQLGLHSNSGANYSWQCESKCSERIDTGVPISSSIVPFQGYAVPTGELDISRVIRPLLPEHVNGVRVYMPQILHHFIECTWGACYNHLYLNCIAPYLDSPEVVDYVLRTPVVHLSADARRGSTGAMIYGELASSLRNVSCPEISDYLRRTFDDREQPRGDGAMPNTYQPSTRQERRSSPSGRRVKKTSGRKK